MSIRNLPVTIYAVRSDELSVLVPANDGIYIPRLPVCSSLSLRLGSILKEPGRSSYSAARSLHEDLRAYTQAETKKIFLRADKGGAVWPLRRFDWCLR